MNGRAIEPASAFATVGELLRHRGERSPGKLAYLFLEDGEREGAELSHGDLWHRTQTLAAEFERHGLGGERALLIYSPGLKFVESFLACLLAGVVAVPVHPPTNRRGLPRLLAIARDAEPAAILTDGGALSKLQKLTAKATALRKVHWLATDEVREEPGPGWEPPTLGPESLAFLQFTSGSTADPKGVMVSHGNLIHNQELMRRGFEMDADSVVVGWLPLYHDMGLIGNVLQPLYVAARCVLMAPVAFLARPLRWLQAIDRQGATAGKAVVSGGPNFAYDLCVRHISDEERSTLDLSGWRVAFNGAEPVRADTLEAFHAAFAPCGFEEKAFYPCYGLAEATLFVTGGEAAGVATRTDFSVEALEQDRGEPTTDGAGRRLVSSGRPRGDQELLVVDAESRRPVDPGRIGEIWLRGDSVARGYWCHPERTRTDFGAHLAGEPARGPFLRTGDLGLLHGGELYVTGRLKDLIILRGRNLYPQDIELTVEASHGALRPGCGAAFAVEVGGEERLVVVWERVRHHEAEAEEVVAAVRRAVTEEHEVRVYEVVLLRVGTVPKTTSGKIRRRACRTAYLADELMVVGRGGAPEMLGESAEDLAENGVEVDAALLLGLAPGERAPVLGEQLRRWAAGVLRVPAEAVAMDRPLSALGLDSLAAVELKQCVESRLGVPQSFAALLAGPTLEELGGEILCALATEAERPVSGTPVRGPAEEVFPLSAGQRALWFLHHLAPASGAYHILARARVEPALDRGALKRALDALVARHEALRTTFEEAGESVQQRVHPTLPPDLLFVDAVETPAEELEELLCRAADESFDLATGPLFRLVVARRPGGGSGEDADGTADVLLLVLHHIIADFWSLATLSRELGVLYDRELGLPAPRLAPIPYTLGDHMRWQREYLEGPRGAADWKFWQRQLAPPLPVLELPTDRPRPAVQTWVGGAATRRLGADVGRGVTRLARDAGCTLFMVLLAGFQAVLARYSGQREVLVGSPTAGRTRSEWNPLVGYFVNPVVLHADLGGGPSVAEFLDRIRHTVLAAFDHQEFPFALLVERLEAERDASRSPIFQALFTLQKTPRPDLEGLSNFALGLPGGTLRMGSLRLESLDLPERTSQFDLSLAIARGDGELVAVLQYNRDLFEATTAERLLGHLEQLLTAAFREPARQLSEIDLLSASERGQLLEWQGTGALDTLADARLDELFAAQAARTPAAVALVAAGEDLRYAELDRRVSRLAHHLRRAGVGPETRVGLLVERSAPLVVALLGISRAGAAAVPLDPHHPPERLAFQLADAAVAVLVTTSVHAERMVSPGMTVCLDTELGEIFGAPPEAPPNPPGSAAGLAYLIYTSGSTGKPKGVGVTHAAAASHVRHMISALGLGPEDRVLQTASISFDVAWEQALTPLLCGARLVLAPPELWPADELSAHLAVAGITVADLPAAYWQQWVEEGSGPGDQADLGALRLISVGGEAMSPAAARRWPGGTGASGARLVNAYGPTETVVTALLHEVRPAAVAERGEVSIGRPVGARRVHILDRGLRPVPAGARGELVIGGPLLARGYLGRPALTAEHFVPDPFLPTPGGRLYRTGDLARFRVGSGDAGEVDFLGRLDHQVKIRGFRIEPGEVERALLDHPAVREAAVAVRDEPVGSGRRTAVLVAWVAVRRGAAVSRNQLRDFLGERLPSYMVPAFFVVLESLPRTAAGKADMRSLPVPERAAVPPTDAPRMPEEELLAGIFCQVLGLPRVGRGEDFFHLGGHSLLATQVVSRVRRQVGVELEVRELFEAPTVEALAPRVRKRLKGAGGGVDPESELVPRSDAPVLSFGQQRLWFLHQLEPESAAYNMPLALSLRGDLDPQALTTGLAHVLARHEVLRAFFEIDEARGGVPRQVIADAASLPLPAVDLRALGADAEAEAGRWLAEAGRRPFDLRRAPLVRALLFTLVDGEYLLLLVMHHIVSDGWSLGVLARELGHFYRAARRGEAPSLEPLPVQYSDFAYWQRRVLTDEILAAEVAWWRRELEGLPPLLELPTDRPRPPMQSGAGRMRPLAWSAELTAGLRSLGQGRGATLFMTLLAGLEVLLGRYSGQRDLAVGTMVAGRTHPATEGLIGFFVNSLVLRGQLRRELRFAEWLERVRERTLMAYAHQEVPFERLVEELEPERSLSHSPLFQVVLLMQNAPLQAVDLPGLETAPVAVESGTAKFDLLISLEEMEEDGAAPRLAGSVEYNRDLFDAVTVDRLAAHLEALLASAVAAPDQPIFELALLGATEREQLRSLAGTEALSEVPESLPRWFAVTAARRSEDPALLCGDETLSYGELARRVDALAERLMALGVGPEERVGVCLERTPRLVVALLAILRAGGAYVPLDPAYPAERVAFLLADAATCLVVSESACRAVLPAECPVLWLDGEPEEEFARGDFVPLDPAPGQLAYVIYTSGSTGVPKGVAITHGSAAALVAWSEQVFSAAECARVLASTSVCFDLSVFELFVPLCRGGCAVLVRDALALGEGPVGEVNLINTVPSALAALLALGDLPPSVQTINVAGEPLRQPLVERAFAGSRAERLLNLYGPSEDTTYSTWAAQAAGGTAPTIGRPVAGTRAFLLNRHGGCGVEALLPVGVVGELYLGGAGLARGYWRRPALTAGRFVPDPFSPQPGARLYHTGDLARWRGQDLEFLGRVDHQVKVRGFRIELGEIETLLAAAPGVEEAVVLVREDRGAPRLVAWVEPRAGAEVTEADLEADLRRRLPEHMIPATWVVLEALPRTANGKIDRKALHAAPPAAGMPPADDRRSAYVAPANAVEEVLADIWCRLLGVEKVGTEDNFFQVGGHSLLVTQLITQIRMTLRVEIPLRRVFEATTIARQARLIVEHEATPGQSEKIAGVLLKVKGMSPEEIRRRLAGRRATPSPRG